MFKALVICIKTSSIYKRKFFMLPNLGFTGKKGSHRQTRLISTLGSSFQIPLENKSFYIPIQFMC
jgi:hypothetical protein